ncbi:MAG: alkaline phosphatase, partial [Myxococcota bacterium]
GAGEVPEHTWLWDNHSNHLVPVFARGTGAGALVDLADERDRRRGAYIQDTEIFDALLAAWALEDPR